MSFQDDFVYDMVFGLTITGVVVSIVVSLAALDWAVVKLLQHFGVI
jgi:hypothetical protein